MSQNFFERALGGQIMEKEAITSTTAVISSIIAIAALAYQMASKRAEDTEKEMTTWQKTAIYDVLDQKLSLNFDELYSAYLNEIANENYRRHVPSKQVTKQELRKIILSLRADQIIDYDSQRKYYVRQSLQDMGSVLFEQIHMQNEQRRIESILMDKLMKESGKTIVELYGEIKKEANSTLSFDNFSEVIRRLWSINIVSMTDDKKVHVNFATYAEGKDK
jgi:hypothetical protein